MITDADDDTAPLRIAGLGVYPVKSCGGLDSDAALLVETGLELDRQWMVVDPAGRFVSQRELPRMALIRPTLKGADLVLRAPGMLALYVGLQTVDAACRATVWNDEVAAYDMGRVAGQWFSDFLGRPLRLVRFDPEQRRLADRRWTGPLEAEAAFADGFPLLIASTASLAELNRRLAAAGVPAVGISRFRPNLVLDGLDAHGEDHLDEIRFDTPDGPVRLKLVKPCTRCTIPDVDPATGETGHAVLDTLAGYRADARVDGGLTFGMNAIVLEGIDCELRLGMEGRGSYRFD